MTATSAVCGVALITLPVRTRQIPQRPITTLPQAPAAAVTADPYGQEIPGGPWLTGRLRRRPSGRLRRTLLVVTHNSAIRLLAHRVVRMGSGQVLEVTRTTPTDAADVTW